MSSVEVTETYLRAHPLPAPGTHKNARGTVGFLGGSRSTPGAVRLSAEAALRAGAGKVRVVTVAATAPALGVAIPEAAVTGVAEDDAGQPAEHEAASVLDFLDGIDAALLGPGLTDPSGAAALLHAVVPRLPGALVLDALGSAYVARHLTEVAALGRPVVITLNPHELGKVLDRPDDRVEAEPEAAAGELARAARAVVSLGGTTKTVATPEGDVFVVRAGGTGLAVSGSGDVHAGLVAGLLARGAEPGLAAVWAAWLHPTAGDELTARTGPVGFLARELLPVVPRLLSRFGGSGA